MSYNNVILIGNLTSDPVKREPKPDFLVCNFSIAINTKTRSGDEVCYMDINTTNKIAEVCNKYLSKGKKVLVEGRLKLNEYTDKNGNEVKKIIVVTENVQFLSPQEKRPERLDTDSNTQMQW